MKSTLIPNWFDIDKYQKQNTLTNYDFAFNLYYRLLILIELDNQNNYKSDLLDERIQAISDFGILDDEFTDDLAMETFFDEWLDLSRLGWKNSVGFGVVSRLPIAKAFDIYKAVQDDTNFRNKVARYEYMKQVLHSNNEADDQELNGWDIWFEQQFLIGSYDELDTSFGKDESFIDIVAVNLDAPDALLIEGFKDWLRNIRGSKWLPSDEAYQLETRDLYTLDKVKPRLINASVLPYIDLKIWSKAKDIKIPYHHIGSAIFPDNFDRDVTESVRKTTKPLARLALNMALRYYRTEVIAQLATDNGIKL